MSVESRTDMAKHFCHYINSLLRFLNQTRIPELARGDYGKKGSADLTRYMVGGKDWPVRHIIKIWLEGRIGLSEGILLEME